MTDIAIAPAGVDDLDVLLPLFQGYLEFYQRRHDAAAVRAFLGARLAQAQSTVFLARIAGRPVGFVQLYPAFASLSLRPSWILNDLYVVADARGQGVAEALMQRARALAVDTGACEIFLQTARDNAPAQRLYDRLGYARDDHFLVYTLDPRLP